MDSLNELAEAAKGQNVVFSRRNPSEVRVVLQRESSGSLGFVLAMAGVLAIVATIAIGWWMYRDYHRAQDEAELKAALRKVFQPPATPAVERLPTRLDFDRAIAASPRRMPQPAAPSRASAPTKTWTIESAVSLRCAWVGNDVRVVAQNESTRDVVRFKIGVRVADRAFMVNMPDVPAGKSAERIILAAEVGSHSGGLPELCVWEGDFR